MSRSTPPADPHAAPGPCGRRVHPHLRLRRSAATTYGVMTRREARRLGIPGSTYEDWCRAEGVVRVHRGVVVLPDAPAVPEQAIAAAVAAAGEGAAAGGWTAAFLHGLDDRSPGRPTVLVPHRRRAPALVAVEVVRTRYLAPSDVVLARRVACTGLERTILDLVAAVGPGDDGLAVILNALQRGLTDVRALSRQAALAGPRRGRPLQVALERLDDRPVDSVFEHLVLAALRRAGLDPEVGLEVTVDGRRLRIDLAFAEARVAVECDGFAFHRTPGDLARDHERQNALVRAGWRVLRISWRRWQRDPAGVVAEVRALVAG